ncbi:protein of unknown function DUF187 [Gloeothece citriformis PCC 7424]|uniref:Glycosyl hydrolase-like 10 domain-containing protein n=1 Tax=Gloeothece citriformis (strain PCC 7424) TaxID=65393 RepID=B7K966_GLOC7|nr:family 10 glycosylhydrolase [Gloeothece citriformis]ACK72835.1 protein of unknown function DUF187 [Gloeothece citriformis PCC 7424]
MKIIRGVWLTNVDSQILNSKQSIIDAINLLADTGFNTVFPVVWNKGVTQYPSEIMRTTFNIEIDPSFQGRDPLAEVIHAAQKVGIDVIPWFEYGFACSYQKNGGHILAKKPHWTGKDQNNNLLKKNGFEWMNAFEEEVQEFMIGLFLEVAKKYDIAGVQGDDRLPGFPCEGGYDDKTKTRYRDQTGRNVPFNIKDSFWLKWRANLLTDFLEKLYQEIKAINKNLIISLSPSLYPFCYQEYLQDYPTWIKKGLVDIIHPQLYRRDLKAYKNLLKDIIKQFDAKELERLFPGILMRVNSGNPSRDFHISPEQLWETIVYNRLSGIKGEVLFFLEELLANDQALANFLKFKTYKTIDEKN